MARKPPTRRPRPPGHDPFDAGDPETEEHTDVHGLPEVTEVNLPVDGGLSDELEDLATDEVLSPDDNTDALGIREHGRGDTQRLVRPLPAPTEKQPFPSFLDLDQGPPTMPDDEPLDRLTMELPQDDPEPTLRARNAPTPLAAALRGFEPGDSGEHTVESAKAKKVGREPVMVPLGFIEDDFTSEGTLTHLLESVSEDEDGDDAPELEPDEDDDHTIGAALSRLPDLPEFGEEDVHELTLGASLERLPDEVEEADHEESLGAALMPYDDSEELGFDDVSALLRQPIEDLLDPTSEEEPIQRGPPLGFRSVSGGSQPVPVPLELAPVSDADEGERTIGGDLELIGQLPQIGDDMVEEHTLGADLIRIEDDPPGAVTDVLPPPGPPPLSTRAPAPARPPPSHVATDPGTDDLIAPHHTRTEQRPPRPVRIEQRRRSPSASRRRPFGRATEPVISVAATLVAMMFVVGVGVLLLGLTLLLT